MKKSKRILIALSLLVLLLLALCVPAFAITESEVETQVAVSGRETVTGNVLLWFLCAVAFLKVSQKIDSFMAALGVNVGRTGGSMLAEAMIAMRTVTMVMGGGRGTGHTSSAAGSTAGRSGASGMAGFFKGGLIGMAGRSVTSSAVKSAVTNTSSLHTAVQQAAADTHINSEVHTGNSTIHTENSNPVGAPPQAGVIQTGSESGPHTVTMENVPPVTPMPSEASLQEGVIITDGENTVHAPQTENIFASGTAGTVHAGNTAVSDSGQHTQVHTERVQTSHTSQTSRSLAGARGRPTLGGMVFSHSLSAGGSYANDVIGTVARGEVAGSITGDMAVQSLSSYMGHASPGMESREAPTYSDVEIGRGRITGVETAAGSSEGLPFAMYHMDQYTAPAGEYTKVVSADGTQWYKQYAQDAVERKPCMAPDDTVAYRERIIKKLPDPPKRKDRI